MNWLRPWQHLQWHRHTLNSDDSPKRKWDKDQSKGGGKAPQSNLLLPNTTEARKAIGKATLSRKKQMRLESKAKSEPKTKDFTVSLKVRAHLSDSYSIKAELILFANTDGSSSFFSVRSASQSLRVSMIESSNDVQPPWARFGVMGWAASPAKVIPFAACWGVTNGIDHRSLKLLRLKDSKGVFRMHSWMSLGQPCM